MRYQVINKSDKINMINKGTRTRVTYVEKTMVLKPSPFVVSVKIVRCKTIVFSTKAQCLYHRYWYAKSAHPKHIDLYKYSKRIKKYTRT